MSSDQCSRCSQKKYLSESQNEAQFLISIAREELKWQNDRAIMVGNRSTFWLGLIIAGLIALIKSDYFINPSEIEALQIPFLLTGLSGVVISAWHFWSVIGIKVVESVDASIIKKFADQYLKRENEYCPKCFAMDEFLTSYHPCALSVLESAVKEADERAESYRKGTETLKWSSALILFSLVLDVLDRASIFNV